MGSAAEGSHATSRGWAGCEGEQKISHVVGTCSAKARNIEASSQCARLAAPRAARRTTRPRQAHEAVRRNLRKRAPVCCPGSEPIHRTLRHRFTSVPKYVRCRSGRQMNRERSLHTPPGAAHAVHARSMEAPQHLGPGHGHGLHAIPIPGRNDVQDEARAPRSRSGRCSASRRARRRSIRAVRTSSTRTRQGRRGEYRRSGVSDLSVFWEPRTSPTCRMVSLLRSRRACLAPEALAAQCRHQSW